MSEYPAVRDPNRPPVHPGALLREDVLPALNMSVTEAAKRLHATRQTLHRILAEKTSITPEMAHRLGKFLGNGPELWINMQVAHDMWHARRKVADDLKKIETAKVAA